MLATFAALPRGRTWVEDLILAAALGAAFATIYGIQSWYKNRWKRGKREATAEELCAAWRAQRDREKAVGGAQRPSPAADDAKPRSP